MEQTDIQEWYSGKNIFITGGTGFMGKVLLEKLLRVIPNVGYIYLLLRPKKGCTPEERVQLIKKLPVFDRLNKIDSKRFDKIKIIEGNMLEENLGLSAANVELLQTEISVVFHMAANLRMEANLKEAITINTLGTKQVLELARKMEKLQAFLYLSTAFCHVDIDFMEEKLYKPHCDPYEIIKYVQVTDDKVLEAEKQKIIAPHPNCYTFSKRLSEWVVKDYEKYFPIAITRPSIVTPAIKEPIPGWVDSLNGPMGLLSAGGKGVLRSMLANKNYNAELIPVDVAVNVLIIHAFLTATTDKRLSVMNLTAPHEVISITWGEVIERGKVAIQEYPYEWTLWYPGGKVRTNVFMHWLVVILFQWIPAILIDILIYAFTRETLLIRVQKRLYHGTKVLQYFTMKQWKFDTKELVKNTRLLSKKDSIIFYNIDTEYDVDEYYRKSLLGTKQYCFKENLKNLPYLKIHMKFLFILHYFCIFYFWYFVGKLCLSYMGYSF